MRASLCDPFLWDHPEGLAMASEIERAPATTERALELLGGELRRNADPDALVRGHVGLYGMGTVTDELTVAGKRCADDNGAVAHAPSELRHGRRRLRRRAVRRARRRPPRRARRARRQHDARAHERPARRRDRRARALGREHRLAPGQLPFLRHRGPRPVPRPRARRARRARRLHDGRGEGLVVRGDGVGRLPDGADGRRLLLLRADLRDADARRREGGRARGPRSARSSPASARIS